MPLVKLPRKRLVEITRKSITVDLPETKKRAKKKVNYAKLKKAEGLLKGKIIDPVAAQKKLRDEWD
jgi:hypothetical protein